jgi:hypothetical protein
MSDDITITSADLEALSTKLDAVELTSDDRALLASIFVLAGQAATAQLPEVEGFINFTAPAMGDGSVRVSNGMLLPAVKTGGLAGGFTFGLHNPPMDRSLPAVQ